MEILVSFILFGAIVGYAAARTRNYSTVAGLLGGAFLGILSPLMFCVSGVTKGDRRKVCIHCKELVKADATVCRYCHSKI